MINVKDLKARLAATLWEQETAAMPRWRAASVRALRILYLVARDLAEGQLSLRAMSLVYTTLLSAVPVLAISFSVLKGIGVHTQIEPMLLNFLAPMGERGVEIANRVIEFVENVKAGVLGSLGVVLLVYTVISLVQKVERAFNFAWHVKRQRPLAQRFSEYLSVILVGPLLVFSALGITASLRSTAVVEALVGVQPFGAAIEQAGRLLPYVLVVGAFTFVYVFVPNTRVRLRSAFVGALVAGMLWETVGWAFASFIVGSAKYTAIYSAFATLILFMVWLYLSWLILLVGGSIAFYHQHPGYRAAEQDELRLSNVLKERLALAIMSRIGRSHYRGGDAPWTAEALARHLAIPLESTEWVLGALERQGLLARTAAEPPAYLPARPLETTLVKEVLDAVRAADERPYLNVDLLPAEPAVEAVVAEIEAATATALAGRTLKDLALAEVAAPTSLADKRRPA